MTTSTDPDGTTLIWGRVDFGGCAYMLSFSNAVTKVGKTTHLRSRFRDHVSLMHRRRGAELVDFYFTRTHVGYSTTEDLFIRAAESVMTAESHKSGREWFFNIDLERLQEALLEADPTNSYTQIPAGCAA